MAKKDIFGVFSVGGLECDTSNLSFETKQALVADGLRHRFNSMSAKLSNWAKGFAKDHGGSAPTDAEYEAKQNELRQEAWEKTKNDTWATGVRSTSEETLREIALELARADAKAKLHDERIARGEASAWPMGTKGVRGSGIPGISGEDATMDFNGELLTRAQIAERQFNKNPTYYLEYARDEHTKRLEAARTKRNKPTYTNSASTSLDNLL